MCTYFKEIFQRKTLRWTEFIALVYDGHVINNVGPCNKFTDKKKKQQTILCTPINMSVHINIPPFTSELNDIKIKILYIMYLPTMNREK